MITEYIQYIADIRGYSHHTAMNYERDLRQFTRWMHARNEQTTWRTITIADIDDYIIHMTNEHKRPATINRALSAIAGIYKWMKRNGHDVKNPVRYESRKKMERRQPNTIPINDITTAILKSTGDTQLILMIAISTGARIQEILDIDQRDIDRERSAIKIHGKGKKDRTVFTSPTVIMAIDQHTQGREGKIIREQDQRRARQMIYDALNESRAKQKSPHAIRHTFATEMAKNGAPTTTIATMMGHADLRTTQRYIDAAATATREAYERYRPHYA